MTKKEPIYPVKNHARAYAPKRSLGRAISNGVYLDYAATTPVDTEVFHAMKPFLEGGSKFGNPNSLHSFGRESLKYIDEARAKIAQSIGADFSEIIFTGSATEANNLALRGVLKTYQHQSVKISINQRPKIIISAIEHESVYETAKDLEREGVEVTIIPVDKNGIIDLKKFEKELDERTILVSLMYANNEIGTVQPITKISELIRNFRNSKLQEPNNKKIPNSPPKAGQPRAEKLNNEYPLFHTDAVQALQFLDCDVKKLGVDFMTLSAHKIYGPKGVGILYRRTTNFELPISNKFQINNVSNSEKTLITNSHTLVPILTGGGQEFGLRSGTQNVAGICGFEKAITLVSNSRELENKRILGLKKELWKIIQKIYPRAEINGSLQHTLPNILNVHFPGVSSELFLIKLDMEGVAVSSGSACHARSQKPSQVIATLYGEKRARESIRFSLGKHTTKEEIKYVGETIKKILETIK